MISLLFHDEYFHIPFRPVPVIIYIFLFLTGCVISTMTASAGSRITLKPVITMDQEYTDNLFLSKESKEEDLITVISPGVIAEAGNRKGSIRFFYNLGYSHYQLHSEYDAWRHNSQLAGNINFSEHTRMEFRNSFLLTEEPAEDIEERRDEDDTEDAEPETYEAETETVRQSRYRYYTNSSQIRLIHQFGKSDSLRFAYACDMLKNEDTTIRNEIKHRPAAALTYWMIPQRVGLDAEISYVKNDISDAKGDPGYLEETLTSSAYMTWWAVPVRLSFKPGLSYIKGVSNEENADDSDNWYESITPLLKIMYRFSRHSSMEAEGYVTKALTYTSEELSDPSDDFETWYGSLTFTHQFHRHFEGFVRYMSSVTDYMGDDNGEDEDYEDYTLYEPSAGIRYILAEGLPLSLSVGYLVRDKKLTGREAAITLNGQLGAWKFCRYGSAKFSASSGYNEDHFGPENLGLGFYYKADASAEYIFSQYITGRVYGRYQRNRYLDNEETGGETRNDKSREFGAGLVFQSRKWWFVRVDYIYRDVSSTDDQDSYEDNRILLKMGISPARGIRIW
ncbi:MAG: outer membrane beta-barrel protein [Desulfococcaceae bacterium]